MSEIQLYPVTESSRLKLFLEGVEPDLILLISRKMFNITVHSLRMRPGFQGDYAIDDKRGWIALPLGAAGSLRLEATDS